MNTTARTSFLIHLWGAIDGLAPVSIETDKVNAPEDEINEIARCIQNSQLWLRTNQLTGYNVGDYPELSIEDAQSVPSLIQTYQSAANQLENGRRLESETLVQARNELITIETIFKKIPRPTPTPATFPRRPK